MAEHVLRGAFGIYHREEGGRQLVIQDGSEVYRLPLNEEAHAQLSRWLNFDDDELKVELDRQAAASKLAVAQPGNGRADGPSLN